MVALQALWLAAWPYLGSAVAVSSFLDAILPQPAPGSHWLLIRKIISVVAMNVANASNGAQPTFNSWLLRVATGIFTSNGIAAAGYTVPANFPHPGS